MSHQLRVATHLDDLTRALRRLKGVRLYRHLDLKQLRALRERAETLVENLETSIELTEEEMEQYEDE